jgi:hypothetical protein
MIRKLLPLLAAVSTLFLLYCVGNNAVSGTGTLIGNPGITGVLYNSDGSFASKVSVHIRKRNFLPDVSRLGLGKRLADTASSVTNDSGWYCFDSTMDTGTYVIDARKGNNAVFIDSVIIAHKDSAVHVPPDTLKPFGTIKGSVQLPQGFDSSNVIVLAPGINGYARIRSDGTFLFAALAEGTYRIQVTGKNGTRVLADSGVISVVAAETTDIIVRDSALLPIPALMMHQITGSLYRPDGSPAESIIVHIDYYSQIWPDSYPAAFTDRSHFRTASTGKSGRFTVDSVPNGKYSLNASDYKMGVFIDSIIVNDPNVIVTLQPDTLKPLGAIKGKIHFPDGGDPRMGLIMVYDPYILSGADSTGYFKFDYLAEGKYRLRIGSFLKGYGAVNKVDIPVRPGDTTDIGTITLPSNGIPAPKNLSISYDTLNQLVTLRWSRPDTALVKGVNVYRRIVGSDTAFSAKINKNLITDAIYIDSTGEQDLIYDYRIAAVRKNGDESAGDTVTAVKIASNFALDTVFNWDTPDMAFAKNGDVYLLTGVFDSTMRLKRELNTRVSGSSIGIDERGLVFVLAMDSIFVLDSTGTVVNAFAYTASNEYSVRGGIKAKDSLIFAMQISAPTISINVFSYQGVRQRAWEIGDSASSAWGMDFHSHVMTGDSKTIMVSTLTSIISYDYSGNKISERALPDGVNFRGCFSFDKERRLLYFVGKGILGETPNRYAYNTLYVMNSENSIIAMYKIPWEILRWPDDLWVHKNGTVYLSGLGIGTLKLKPLF